jgi:S1-C subfamily serine protease
MSFAVTSGVYYHFKFVLTYQTAGSTVGLKLGLTFPATTVMSARASIQSENTITNATINVSGEYCLTAAVSTANTNYPAEIEGVILPSANGTLQVQFASGNPGDDAKIKQGSVGFLNVIS